MNSINAVRRSNRSVAEKTGYEQVLPPRLRLLAISLSGVEIMQQRNFPLKTNLLFWVLYFTYEWFGLAALSGDYRSYFINACVAFPMAFACSYLTVNVLLNKFYDRWPKWKFWLVQVLLTILCLLAKRCLNYFIIYPKFFPVALELPFFSFGKLIVELVNVYLIVGVYSLFYFVMDLDYQRQQVKDMIQEKTLAELDLLKSQVQPHFIFNTLNNIYSSALKSSPETAALISHLSSFLNYNLYEAKLDFVPLHSELLFIRGYLGIQCNRYGSMLDTSVNLYDDITGMTIAPMLLLPLIENCFKHGIGKSIHSGWVRLDISTQKEILIIKIENSIGPEPENQDVRVGGLGVKNVKRRLELLYPGRYEMQSIRENYAYLVILKINTQ